MPIQRQQLGGAFLSGAGDALQNYAEYRLKRRDLQQQQAQQMLFDLYKQRQQHDLAMQQLQATATDTFMNKMMESPLNAQRFANTAKSNPLLAGVAQSMVPSATDLTQLLQEKYGSAEKDTQLPSPDVMNATAQASGLDTTGVTSTEPVAGAQFLDPSMPADVVERNNPNMQAIRDTIDRRRADLNQAEQDAIENAGKKSFAQFYNQRTAENQSDEEYAPSKLQNELDAIKAKGPLEAANAESKRRAELRAENSPENMDAQVQAEFRKATARQTADLNARLARINAGIPDPDQRALATDLATEFAKQTEATRSREDTYGLFRNIVDRNLGKSDESELSPTDTNAALVLMSKILEPTSAVTAGERKVLEDARPMAESLKVARAAWSGGTNVSVKQLREYAKTAYAVHLAARDEQLRAVDRFSRLAAAQGIPASRVVIMPDLKLDRDPQLDIPLPGEPNAPISAAPRSSSSSSGPGVFDAATSAAAMRAAGAPTIHLPPSLTAPPSGAPTTGSLFDQLNAAANARKRQVP